MGLGDNKIGTLCKQGHRWNNSNYTLRNKHGKCIECEKNRDRSGYDKANKRKYQREYYHKNKDKILTRRNDPEKAAARREYIRRHRAINGRPSRSKAGFPYTPMGDTETRLMRRAIRLAGRIPSVAQLVYEQQVQHWKDFPDDRIQYVRVRAKEHSRWRFMTDIKYRLYHRAKAKARKVAQRGGTPFHLSPTQLWRRWCDFDHCCAYCGASGDLQVEHVVPISKGGEHHLGNIVPACHRCNSSKSSKDAHTWYRAQPFYEPWRWHNIQSILNKSKPMAEQISLFAC